LYKLTAVYKRKDGCQLGTPRKGPAFTAVKTKVPKKEAHGPNCKRERIRRLPQG